METEYVLANHERITDRIARRIDEQAQMEPTASTPILLAILEAKIDLLLSLGIRLKAVGKLHAKLVLLKEGVRP
jgi:hypothetical protein